MVGEESNEENILVKDESDEDNMEVSLMSEDFENNGLEEITNS